jgi:hypothetical protein
MTVGSVRRRALRLLVVDIRLRAIPKSHPASCAEVPWKPWIFWAAISHVSAARSSADSAASPCCRVDSHVTRRPA